MTETYVYILSWHDEHGAEAVHATLNRDVVRALLRDAYGDDPRWHTEADSKLAELLEHPDEELSRQETNSDELHGVMPHKLCNGWGGPQLHVVKLEGNS